MAKETTLNENVVEQLNHIDWSSQDMKKFGITKEDVMPGLKGSYEAYLEGRIKEVSSQVGETEEGKKAQEQLDALSKELENYPSRKADICRQLVYNGRTDLVKVAAYNSIDEETVVKDYQLKSDVKFVEKEIDGEKKTVAELQPELKAVAPAKALDYSTIKISDYFIGRKQLELSPEVPEEKVIIDRLKEIYKGRVESMKGQRVCQICDIPYERSFKDKEGNDKTQRLFFGADPRTNHFHFITDANLKNKVENEIKRKTEKSPLFGKFELTDKNKEDLALGKIVAVLGTYNGKPCASAVSFSIAHGELREDYSMIGEQQRTMAYESKKFKTMQQEAEKSEFKAEMKEKKEDMPVSRRTKKTI